VDLQAYFTALSSDAVSIWTGIASVLLALVGLALKREKLPSRLLWLAAAACFFLASGRVWTTEHRRGEQLEDELHKQLYPQFSCEINQVSTVAKESAPTGSSAALLIATLKNTGAPSVAGDYRLTVTLLDQRQVSGILLTVPESLPVLYPNGFRRVVKRSQALYNKTTTPVGHNSVSIGFLLFQFDGLNTERLSATAQKYELTLKDLYNKPTSCSKAPDQTGPGTALSFPGLDDGN